jgi:hypothetical protein
VKKMKKQLFIVLFVVAAISLTGCYTQLVVEENDDSYIYSEPVPIIIYYPVPEPIYLPVPLPCPPQEPVQPIYKERKPETPPPSKDRVRDDIRNSGGRNDGGRNSRR